MDDFHAVEGFGLGDFLRVVGDVHHQLSDFTHGIVVHRRDEAIRRWRNLLRDPLVHTFKWLRPGFPTFAVLGKGIPALRNSTRKSRGGYLCYLRLLYPG